MAVKVRFLVVFYVTNGLKGPYRDYMAFDTYPQAEARVNSLLTQNDGIFCVIDKEWYVD